VHWSEDVGGASTGLLAALVCKPGMRSLCYPQAGRASVDEQLLVQMAAGAGVLLEVY
jgi:hypothetical protein